MDPMTTPPPAGGLTSTTPYRSGRLRAQATVILLAASIVSSLLTPLVIYLQIAYPNVVGGVDIAEAPPAPDNMDLGGLLVGLLFIGAGLSIIVVFIATVVAFSMWIHRAYANLPALGNPKEGLEYSPGWAVGGFFIPIANLFIPYRVTKEIWVKSDPSIRSDEDFMFSVPQAATVVGWWWAFWLISNFANKILFRWSGDPETPEALLRQGHLSVAVAVLEIVAAVLAIKVVRGIDRRQEERSKHVRFTHAAPPPPTQYATPDTRPQS